MIDGSEFELLAELARLLKKYGPETFEGLAEHLSSPEFSQRLVTLLSATARQGRAMGVSEDRQLLRNIRTSLTELQHREPEKAKLLLRLYDGMVAKNILPTRRDIEAFVSEMGLLPIKTNVRKTAIASLINALMVFPIDELKAKLSTTDPIQDDRSLEGWSNIILDRGRSGDH